jgi:nucleoid DNA-binding protein
MTVQGGHVPNKAEFIEELAGRLQTDKKQAGMILDTVLDSIYGHVAKGEKVVLTGFGIFEKRDRAARMARNPATGASVRVRKTSVPPGLRRRRLRRRRLRPRGHRPSEPADLIVGRGPASTMGSRPMAFRDQRTASS